MAAPILLPIITTAGFDPIWFAVILTINMEIGLISPPVGLNFYVINGIAPDISLRTILIGSLPFMGRILLAIVLLCFFLGIATWLPEAVMGPRFSFKESYMPPIQKSRRVDLIVPSPNVTMETEIPALLRAR